MAAAVALGGTRSAWFGLARARAAGIELFPYGCRGTEAPRLGSVPTRAQLMLGAELSAIMPARVGREYESGWITARNLWTDNQPAPSRGSTEPAGYERRWWALDRDGSEDDVVADVLEFPTPARANAALALAANARCRRDGTAHALAAPTGSLELHWVNPDDAQQWDVIFVRGRRLYRVSDVPPEYLLSGTGAAQGAIERTRAEATPRVLACRLPHVACPPSAAAFGAGGLAALASSPAHDQAASREPTEGQARAYARAVNLRGYDLPGYPQVTPEGPVEDRGSWATFARCADISGLGHSIAALHSPEFEYRGPHQYELAYSLVAVLPSSAQAARLVSLASSPRGRACIARGMMRRQVRRRRPGGELLSPRVSSVEVAQQAAPAPAGYRGPGPYRASAVRATAQIAYGPEQLPLYVRGFLFADGRALVELVTESLLRPFPEGDERFLEGVLVGRAQAGEGSLAGWALR